MTRLSFPFGVIGLVHVENEIEQLRPLDAERDARRPASARPTCASTSSGRQFDVVAVRGGRRARRCGARARPTCTARRAAAARRSGKKERSAPPAAERHLDRPGRPGPPLRRRVGRLEPHPPASAHRAPVRLPQAHRPRHVGQGPLPGRAGGPPAGGLHGRRALQAADADPGQGRVLDVRAGRRAASSPCTTPARASRTSPEPSAESNSPRADSLKPAYTSSSPSSSYYSPPHPHTQQPTTYTTKSTTLPPRHPHHHTPLPHTHKRAQPRARR